MDWIEQGLTSHQTHYRSYRGRGAACIGSMLLLLLYSISDLVTIRNFHKIIICIIFVLNSIRIPQVHACNSFWLFITLL